MLFNWRSQGCQSRRYCIWQKWRLRPRIRCRWSITFAFLEAEWYWQIVIIQFIDYTKNPLYAQLLKSPPSTKYHVIFDAVGVIDLSLFTHSEKYLAPNGIFVSSGPMPTKISFDEAWKLAKTLLAIFTPAILGGINRRYSWATVVLVSGTREALTDQTLVWSSQKIALTIWRQFNNW